MAQEGEDSLPEEGKETEDAPKTDNSDDSASWWGGLPVSALPTSSWLQQAKEKTWSTYELVKKDLGEFSSAVQTEAKHVASATASVIKDQATNISHLVATEEGQEDPPSQENPEEGQNWGSYYSMEAGKLVKSFVDTVNKALILEDTTAGEQESEVALVVDQQFGLSVAPRLYAIQSDPETFLAEPEGAPELFDDFLEHFNLDEHKADISQLLGRNPQIRNIFAQLVPSQVSHSAFWERYFYKVHQYQLDEARRQALLLRSERIKTTDQRPELEAKSSWGDSECETGESALPTTPNVSESSEAVTATPLAEEMEEAENGLKPSAPTVDSASSPDSWSVCSASGDVLESRDSPEQGVITPTKISDRKESDDWCDWEEEH